MKKIILICVFISNSIIGFGQEKNESIIENTLKEFSKNGCNCIQLIQTDDKKQKEIAFEIGECINDQATAYQMISKLMNLKGINNDSLIKNKKREINISTDDNSIEYKKYYYELERYMMSNCTSLKEKIALNEKTTNKSISENKKALKYYSKGIEASKKNAFKKAIKYFKKAVKEDSKFAFAWDNLGLSYRKLNKYDYAIKAYEKSLEIDPYGVMPLQNIAIVYQYKKEYEKAIQTYGKLAKIHKDNPEVYFGIGKIYAINLKKNEKGLDYLCRAYNIYIEQKSPYRTDAEDLINYIYSEMKKDGKEKKFNKILMENKILIK